MTKTFCDRCGNEIKSINRRRKYSFHRKIYIPIIYGFNDFYANAQEIALCESCIKSFESWFENEI